MIRNYFKTAFRYLGRNKLYTSINILGLTLGITCALFAILYVKDEMSFDDFHQKGKQLYCITTMVSSPREGLEVLGTTGQVQGPAFNRNSGAIDHLVPKRHAGNSVTLRPY